MQGLRARGHRHVIPLMAPRTSRAWSSGWRGPATSSWGLGAGNITQWAYALPGELAALGAVA